MTRYELTEKSPEALLGALSTKDRLTVEKMLKQNDYDYLRSAQLYLSERCGQRAEGRGEMIKREIGRFLCGDPSYEADRKALHKIAKEALPVALELISVAVGAKMGGLGIYLVPAVVLLLIGIGKIGLNAWCSVQGY